MIPILKMTGIPLLFLVAFLVAQSQPDTMRKQQKGAPRKDTLVFPRTDSLQQVTVTAPRNPLQIENGKMVWNLAGSALTTGGSVFDLLTKMPGMSVSQEDQLSLRGSEGLQVLIDGKMNYLTGKQLADYLKGLGADNVARIEVITTPGASFDAAGNAGIINIITRKRNNRGYAIDLRSGVSSGSFWMMNQNISASLHTSRFSVYGSFDYNTPHRQLKSQSSNDLQESGTSYQLKRTNTGNYKIRFYTYRAGAEWQLNNRHQLSAHYHGYFDDFKAPKDAMVRKYNAGQLHSVIHTKNNIVEPYHYDAGNIAYNWTIDTSGRKLTVEGHYIHYRNLSDGLMTGLATDGITDMPLEENALRYHQPGYITIRSGKADLEWPYRQWMLKAGLKYATVSNDNQYRFDSLIGSSFHEAQSMSDHFLYKEKIAAAYLTVAKKFNRTSVVAGLRAEHTDARGQTVKQALSNKWQYLSLFPSFSLDQELAAGKLSLSFSRRINRPTYSELNPVRWYTDQYYYYAGNPGLVPEIAWLVSAGWTFRKKNTLTATYGFREHYITRRLEIDTITQAVKSQTANFNRLQRFDLLLATPFHAGPWSLQASAGLNYSLYPIPQEKGEVTASQWAANLQLQQQLKLPAGFRLELATFFYSRELWGIYLKEGIVYADAGLRKSFQAGKFTVQVSFTDILRTYRVKGASLSSTTNYRFYDRPDIRRVSLTVRYHIGGQLFHKKANSIEEQERL